VKKGRRRGRGESAIYKKARYWKVGKDENERVRSRTQWVAVVSEGRDPKSGKRRRKFLYADSQDEAQKALFKYLVQHGGSNRASDGSSFAAFAGAMLEDVRANRSANTARSYEGVLTKHVLPHIGSLRLEQLDGHRIQQLYSDLRRTGVSASLLARVHVVLRRLLNTAKKRQLIAASPLEHVEAPKYRRPLARALTVEQIGRLFKAARGDRLEALFVLAATTGMRQGELFALRWEDLDLHRRTLSVTRSVEEAAGELRIVEPKTASGRRRIELSLLAVDALKRRGEIAKKERHRSPLVFPGSVGGLLRKSNFLRRVYYPLRDEAKISGDIPFHALRHTSASLLLLQGVSPRVVQEMLGHADVRLTLSTYSHVLPTLQRQAADALDALLRPRKRRADRTVSGTMSVQVKPAGSRRRKKSP
jgi:integrase